jgi:aminotransferase MxcL
VAGTEQTRTGRRDVIDVTTTAVGRRLLVETYESFFRCVESTATFRVVVTIDPAYPVPPGEVDEVVDYLRHLPQRHPAVAAVVVERFERHVGLQAALLTLFAHCRSEVGLHLEDDWRFDGPVALDDLVADLIDQDSTMIVLGNSHAARGGTFERPGESSAVPGARTALLRLLPTSWAAAYLPLCPHVHQTERWVPAMTRALLSSDSRRCPDERLRELVVDGGTYGEHRVLWTADVIAHDTGRAWLIERGLHRTISPTVPPPVPAAPAGETAGALSLQRSAQLVRAAEAVIPGMTGTFHKRPIQFAPGEYPAMVERGRAGHVWDVDGNRYIDLISGLGALTLGYDHPAVTTTIHERVDRGVLFSLPTPAEHVAATALCDFLGDVDQVRFFKTGAEACAAAVRLARHLTGRSAIALVGYHGWHDQFVPGTPGVPSAIADLSVRVDLRDAAADEALLDLLDSRAADLAALVLSVPYHRVLPPGLLPEVRRRCSQHGTLLVCDEIVTGFRLAPGGAHQHFGVDADLSCYSKGLAAGMPVAALAGRRDHMQALSDLHVSSTFCGEVLSLEVLKATLRAYREHDLLAGVRRLGRRLRDEANAIARSHGFDDIFTGYDPLPCLRLADDDDEHGRRATSFLAAIARRGVLLRRDVNFPNAGHTDDDIDGVLAAIQPALAEMQRR